MTRANPMHLRDVAMNAIGAFANQDVNATYLREPSKHTPRCDAHVAVFTIDGKHFQIIVMEI